MSKLLGSNGKPLKRPEVRELERDIVKNLGTIIPGMMQDIEFLGTRVNIFIEVFKALGVTDEQFQEAVDRVKAKYQEEPEAVQ
ncbi:MAG: hypothetical protein WC616_02460 [Candidatus Omnitrophota bacterium]